MTTLVTKRKTVNAFTNLFDQKKAEELYREADKHFWPIIGTINQIAANAVYDAYDLLSSKKLLRHAVKASANKTIEDWNKYQRSLKKELGDRWFLLCDVVNIASNNIEKDILKLHLSIKTVMDKHRVPDSDVRSIVFVSQTLLELAVSFFDSYMRQFQSQTYLDITSGFRLARLGDMMNRWKPVTSYFAHYKGSVDLNDDANIKLAISVILARFARPDFINDAAGKAMHLNPDMAKYASEEDKKYFEPEK